MPLSERENTIRAIRFEGPEWVPCQVNILAASWDQYRRDMEAVVARHPTLFPDFEPGRVDYDNYDFGAGFTKGEKATDSWGCTWLTEVSGLLGQVIDSPLDDWSKFDTYRAPDPLVQGAWGPADWDGARKGIEAAKAEGRLTSGGLEHGYLLMRLWYLRGFENLMLDFAADEPRLQTLIDMVVEHSRKIVEQYLAMGVDMMMFPEDLGTQEASIISPAAFRKWIAPPYTTLMAPCREAGVIVNTHSDGYIMELVDDMIACGMDIINPQDMVNGIDDIARHIKGRVCIRLDVDRQKTISFGTRREIRALIEREIRTLGSPEGGLMMMCEIGPPTPPENLDAVCDALEEFRTYWSAGQGS